MIFKQKNSCRYYGAHVKCYWKITMEREEQQMNFTIAAGPIIGAVIGYFTNYLAVKMLFRPRQEIKLFGKRLPFTPGVIPKGKSRLAKSMGTTIADTLLTKEDIGKHLLSENMKDAAADKALKIAEADIKDGILQITGMESKAYEEKREILCDSISGQICDAVAAMPIREKVEESMKKGIDEKLAELKQDGMMGSVISMMVNDEMIDSIVEPISGKICSHIDKHGMDYIRPAVDEKIGEMENSSAADMLSAMNVGREEFKEHIKSIYHKVIETNMDTIMNNVNLASLIEEKINGMDVIQLEDMVMSVMRKELNTIVNLGALIGFIIGMLNIFI